VVDAQVLCVHVRVLVEDDSRIEQEGGVEELLHLPHELVGLGSPLHLYEWRHVAAGAVLRLERAAVLDRNLRGEYKKVNTHAAHRQRERETNRETQTCTHTRHGLSLERAAVLDGDLRGLVQKISGQHTHSTQTDRQRETERERERETERETHTHTRQRLRLERAAVLDRTPGGVESSRKVSSL